VRDYRKIKAWELADDLAVSVYGVTQKFPKSEIYGLTSQMRRAAVSTAANIVEGASRRTKADYLHFLYMVKGSLAEVGYYVHLSKRLGFVTNDDYLRLNELHQEASAILYGLIKSVEKEV